MATSVESKRVANSEREFSANNIKNYVSGLLQSFGSSGFSAMLFSSWLAFVYTEYLGVGAALIALVLSVAAIVEMVADFGAGIMMDRVITRWGKARHWFVVSALPVGVTMVLLWYVPESFTKTAAIVWALIFYNIFNLLIVIVRIAGQATPALISDNPRVRSNMAYAVNITASLSSVVLGWLISGVTSALGQNLGAYRVLVVICAIVTTLCLLLCGLLLTEKRTGADWKLLQETYRVQHRQERKETVLQQVLNLLKNTYWVAFVVMNLFCAVGVFFSFGVMAYWLRFVLGDLTQVGIYSTALNLPTVIGTLLYMPLGRRFDIRTIAMVTAFGATIASAVMWIAGANNFEVLLWAQVVKAFLGGLAAPVLMVMIPRIVDFGEWKTGSRQEGLCNSGTIGLTKIMSAVATALVGTILASAGYAGGGEISPGAIETINFLFLGVPTIAMALYAVAWIFFRLTEEQATRYRAEVAERRAAVEPRLADGQS